MDLFGLVLGNSTQRRVDHPACARVLAMHREVGGVLGPFTYHLPAASGLGPGEDGERVGVSEAGVGGCGGLGVTSGPVAVAECRVARVRLAGAGVAG